MNEAKEITIPHPNCEFPGCPHPAQFFIQDLMEQEPDHETYAQEPPEPLGTPHPFCKKHLRKHVTVPWNCGLVKKPDPPKMIYVDRPPAKPLSKAKAVKHEDKDLTEVIPVAPENT